MLYGLTSSVYTFYIGCTTTKQKEKPMKKFKLTVFTRNEARASTVITASSREELKRKKIAFLNWSGFRKPIAWVGVKRIK